jgi:hypothetical protein
MATARRGTSRNKPVRLDRRVIVVLRGGLGNQLFQWCAGEMIRHRTGSPEWLPAGIHHRQQHLQLVGGQDLGLCKIVSAQFERFS